MAWVGRVGKICWGDIFFEATNQKRGAQAAACCSCWIGVAVYGLHVEVLRKRLADGVGLEVPGHKRLDFRYRPALSDAG